MLKYKVKIKIIYKNYPICNHKLSGWDKIIPGIRDDNASKIMLNITRVPCLLYKLYTFTTTKTITSNKKKEASYTTFIKLNPKC